MLTGALALSSSLAFADEETTPAAPVAGGAQDAPAPAGDGTDAPAPAGDGTGPSAPAGQDPAGGGAGDGAPVAPPPGGGGFWHSGSPAGAATFTQLPQDPAYPVPAPPENEDLPVEVDADTAYQNQLSCDPEDRPGVTAFALLITEHYGREGWSGARPCVDYMSQHHDGRAMDWAIDASDPHERRIGDAAVAWLTEDDGEMMRRFGIEYIIWNGLVFMKDDNEWRHYVGPSPHTDHVHFSFTWDGAMMRTSWWTGVAVTRPDLGPCEAVAREYAALHTFPRFEPCADPAVPAPASGFARVRPGEAGEGVAMLQGVLGVEATGVLDGPTRLALLEWQDEHELPATGVADALTYAAAQGQELGEIPASAQAVTPQKWQVSPFTPYKRTTLTQGDQGAAVTLLQEALGAEPDGDFGPKTAQALSEWEQTVPVLAEQARRRGEDEPAVVTPLTWLELERAAHPTMVLRDVELAEGSRDIGADPEGELAARAALEGSEESPYAGGAVAVLQELLGVEADGSFGPLTAKAVLTVQQEAGLEATGEVDGPTWVAVEEAAVDAGRVAGAPGLEAQRAREEAAREKKEQQEREAEQERQRAQEAHDAAVEDAGR
ncbi:peptidoglycan-binding protein [Serinicoccus sediminis]|uniref:peptidoglycan-binding domain-containing protein n=1 Tax=Serinicoccus sediminis TaxID=2306021 RepID=UPI00101F5D8D|nr:peptidoglycan-binding protein [Serinicoccus sediminis]